VLHAARRKYRTQKIAKNSPSGTIAQICRAVSSQLRHVSTIGNNLLNSNMSFTCPHNMANLGPLMAEIGSGVWGTLANFNGFRVLSSLLQRRCSSEAKWPTKLCTMCGCLLGWYTIHFRGLLPPDRILPGAKFTLRPSLAFFYIGSITARHSSSGRILVFLVRVIVWRLLGIFKFHKVV